MSQSDAPSNAELAERTARIETEVGHVKDTVDRIETNLNEQHEELVDDIEENGEKVARIWMIYRIGRWLVPIGVGVGGAIGSLASGGFI